MQETTEQDVKLVRVNSIYLAVIRKTSSFSHLGTDIMASLKAVTAFLQTDGLEQAGHNIVIYLDTVTNVEIGVQVANRFANNSTKEGDVICSTSPSGLTATLSYFGDYSGLQSAHDTIRTWCTNQQLNIAGPNWEVYGDWHENPEQRRTDVYYLLEETDKGQST